jgi:hypothetical protein
MPKSRKRKLTPRQKRRKNVQKSGLARALAAAQLALILGRLSTSDL